jgi:4-hydroxy-tetrahydrodipicolinate synthase
MLYDIPSRSSVQFETETLLRLGEHPAVVAVKDAKGDLQAATRVMAGSDLAFYAGDDGMTLAFLGARRRRRGRGDHPPARTGDRPPGRRRRRRRPRRRAGEHRAALPLVDAVMTRMPGLVAVKAALHLLGLIPTAAVRPALVPATDDQLDDLRAALVAASLL